MVGVPVFSYDFEGLLRGYFCPNFILLSVGISTGTKINVISNAIIANIKAW